MEKYLYRPLDGEQRRGPICCRLFCASCGYRELARRRRHERAGRDLLGAPARGTVLGGNLAQRRILVADCDAIRTTRREAAAGGRRAQIRRQPLDGLEPLPARQIEPRHRAHQAESVGMAGPQKDVVGRALLDDTRRIHHVDAVGVARHDAEVVRDHDQRDVEAGATDPSSARGSAPGW